MSTNDTRPLERLALGLATLLALPLAVQLGWNLALPDLAGVPRLIYPQALGLVLLAAALALAARLGLGRGRRAACDRA